MSTRKKIIIVGIVLSIICLIGVISIYKRIHDVNTEIKDATNLAHNYVTNSTTETTTEVTTINTTEATTEEITTEYIPPKMYFTVDEDKNKDNKDISYNTISIDGKIVTFPCSYEDIKNIFGTLYVNYGKQTIEVNESDYTDITSLECEVIPTTGQGLISFKFISDKATDLKNCKCTEVSLCSTSYDENDQLYTISLLGNLHWGSTKDDIYSVYGKVPEEYHTTSTNDYQIYYKIDKNEYYFYGDKDRLYQVTFKYNNK